MIVRALSILLVAGGLHAASAPDWVRTAMQQPVPSLPPRTTAVVLLDRTVLTITPADVHVLRQRVVKIVAPAGREHAYGAAVFDDRTKLLKMRGWSIDRDGKVRAVRERDAIETSAASFEVFTDAKVKVLDLPAETGGIIAYEYETRERPYELSYVWDFQETIPVARAVLEVRRQSEAVQYVTKWMNYTPAQDTAGPVWELRDIPAIADEPRRPADATVAGRLAVSWGGQRSWSHVAAWFHELAASRLASTPPLAAKTRELTANATDPIRALARFTQRDVRYVAVEIGIGGYQPHAAADVFANRFGDCKDKSTLLHAMLANIGVPAHYVLVHTTRGVVDPSFPSIHAFNHVISAIRIPNERAKDFDAVIEHPRLGTLLLFDPTSTTTRFGQLPSYLQASRGLLVTAEGGDLIELPAHVPAASGLRRMAKLQLDEQGALRGSVEEIRTGAMAAAMRDLLQPLNATERVRVIESSLAFHLANQTAADVKIENVDDPETDLVVRYTLAAPAYATHVADMLLVRPRVIGVKGEAAVDLAERKHTYVTDGPSVQTDEVEIALPAAAVLDELPKPVALTTPHVEYASSSRFEKGVLRYTRKYTMKAHTVDRAAIPALNEAFARIAADERASAVFR